MPMMEILAGGAKVTKRQELNANAGLQGETW